MNSAELQWCMTQVSLGTSEKFSCGEIGEGQSGRASSLDFTYLQVRFKVCMYNMCRLGEVYLPRFWSLHVLSQEPIFRGFQPRLHVPASTPQGSEQLCITPKQEVLLQLPAVFNKCRGAYTKVSEQLCITPKQAVQCLVRSPPSTTEVEGCIYQGFCITGTFVIECSC